MYSLLILSLVLIGQASIANSDLITDQVLVCQGQTLTCQDKSFEYELPLDSFYRLELTKDLPKFEEYLITYDTCLADVFKQNKNDKLSLYIREYNMLISDILSERTANDLYEYGSIYLHQMNFNYYKQLISTILDDYFSSLSDISTDCEAEMNRMNKSSHKRFGRAEKVLDILINLKKGYISRHLLSKNQLAELLQLEDYMANNKSTRTFIDEPFDVYYNKKIATFIGSKISRKSLFRYNPVSFLTLSYAVYIPFEDKNHQVDVLNSTTYSTLTNTYTNSTVTNSIVTNTTLTDTTITGCTINLCSITSSNITNCNISNSTITSSTLRNCTITGCTLTHCNLSNCIVTNCTITNCTIIKMLPNFYLNF